VLVAFFPVLVNTLEGMERIDRDLMDLFDSLGATSWQKLLRLEFPSALHMVLAGFRVTLTLCLIGAVLAEMVIGDMIGLGYRIKEANAHFRVDLVFGCLALLGVLPSILLWILSLLSHRLQPWLPATKGEL
jgi:ABC-type nitrate/sulfonate/bicarbonate transport system permease component